jgi:hypothetical protein
MTSGADEDFGRFSINFHDKDCVGWCAGLSVQVGGG